MGPSIMPTNETAIAPPMRDGTSHTTNSSLPIMKSTERWEEERQGSVYFVRIETGIGWTLPYGYGDVEENDKTFSDL